MIKTPSIKKDFRKGANVLPLQQIKYAQLTSDPQSYAKIAPTKFDLKSIVFLKG